MELRQLEHFVAVSAEMNFSRAAHRLHVVQSAVSMSVAKLEKELGIELFDRSKRQIALTPAGELFREHARRVIHAARLAKDSISDFEGRLSGVVEFGSLVSVGPLDLPRILGEFHRSYPLVRLILRQDPSGSMNYLSALADGVLDLALISAPDRFPLNMEMTLISEEQMLFVCRPGHPLAGREDIGIPELAEEEFLGFPAQFGLRRVVTDAFADAGVVPCTPYEVAVDFATAADMVRNGLGSIFMPRSEVGRFSDLAAIPVLPGIDWRIYLAWARNERMKPASAKLAELLLASAGRDTRILTDRVEGGSRAHPPCDRRLSE